MDSTARTHEGVSPIVGAILMVAVTVLMAASVSVFVFGIGQNVDNSKSLSTNLVIEEQPNQRATITNYGDSADTDNWALKISAGGESATVYPNNTTTGSLSVSATGALFDGSDWATGQQTSLLITDSYTGSATVSVVHIAEGDILRTSEITTTVSDDGTYADCLERKQAGASSGSGTYTIDPDGDGSGFTTYCDMETAGGGWTLIGTVTDEDGADGPWSDTRGFGTWQNESTFGNISSFKANDYKNPAWSSVPANNLLVAWDFENPNSYQMDSKIWTTNNLLNRKSMAGLYDTALGEHARQHGGVNGTHKHDAPMSNFCRTEWPEIHDDYGWRQTGATDTSGDVYINGSQVQGDAKHIGILTSSCSGGSQSHGMLGIAPTVGGNANIDSAGGFGTVYTDGDDGATTDDAGPEGGYGCSSTNTFGRGNLHCAVDNIKIFVR